MGKHIQALLQYYRKHLAKYFILRLVRSIATTLYVYLREWYFVFFRRSCVYRARLISLKEYKDKHPVTSIKIVSNQINDISPPKSFTTGLVKGCERGRAAELASPNLEISYLQNAVTVAGSYLTVVGGHALYPDAFNPATDASPIETFGVGRIHKKRKFVALFLDQPKIKIQSAINLLGQNAGNYAHWLTEILPKLAIVNQHQELNGLPLLVDGWIHANLHESVQCFNEQGRQVIFVNRWQAVAADELIDISLPGYEPYIPQELFTKVRPLYVNSFSRYALNLLREQCCSRVRNLDLKAGSRKIYLKRAMKSSNVRRVANMVELEGVLAEQGFQFIEAETLSFKEQVSACLNAEIIVGAVGAALANIIFAPKGCRVLALAPYYRNGNYYYYSNLAGVLDHDLCYVLGKPMNNGNHPMHQDYHIDKGEFASAITQALSRMRTS